MAHEMVSAVTEAVPMSATFDPPLYRAREAVPVSCTAFHVTLWVSPACQLSPPFGDVNARELPESGMVKSMRWPLPPFQIP
jgi:hypothetical protein